MVEAVTYGHPACHRRPGTCLTRLVSVGHDFGIEIDGSRFPGI